MQAHGTVTDRVAPNSLEYLDLERRVDGLKNVHTSMLGVAKVYETQTYDYPTQLRESLTEFGGNVAHTFTYLAAAATKGEFFS